MHPFRVLADLVARFRPSAAEGSTLSSQLDLTAMAAVLALDRRQRQCRLATGAAEKRTSPSGSARRTGGDDERPARSLHALASGRLQVEGDLSWQCASRRCSASDDAQALLDHTQTPEVKAVYRRVSSSASQAAGWTACAGRSDDQASDQRGPAA